MISSRIRFLGAAAIVTLAACSDPLTTTASRFALTDAFLTVPVGFDAASSSFGATEGSGTGMWIPMRGHGGEHGMGMMGGGLGPEFFGAGPGFGGGPHGHGPFGEAGASGSCTFAATTGIVTCSDTHGGLTITKLIEYKNAAGQAQSAFDSTTNSMRVRTTVTGTVTRRDSATSTVQHSSDRTVTGLTKTATQRTVNGTAQGSETTTGTSPDGAFTATRTVSDTTKGIVIPVSTTGPTYPTAGSIIRNLKATKTIAGSTTSTTRREVVTYDGSATAKIIITQDGTTKTCTMPLPRGQLSCS
ncbi:MAG: hypothetical protein U0163_20970 [Gemmatimonadaceae bacterium]